jgi:D-alanyl-D-alanine carboxypeptidase/D-alanyl-D-alanine-endopeptidase (penicillin-binding protein 4)
MRFCILIFCFTGLLSLTVFASENTDKNWAQQLKMQGLAQKDQSYCYNDDSGNQEGVNLDMRIRLASVSKLLTSLWAVDTLSAEFHYDMKLFIKDKNLHIQGSYDPFLGNEKMFYLLSQLNELGYEQFDTITFDKNVLVNPDAQYESDEYPTMNAVTNARFLKMYFNTNTWSADAKSEYANYFTMAKKGKFRKEVNFTVSNVKYVDVNPYLNDSTAKVLTLTSPPLYKYLKEMNIRSNNYVAETVFRQLGGVAKFQAFLSENFNLNNDVVRFYTGSGLPSTVGGVRNDNYATCSVMLKLIEALKKTLEKQNKTLEDLMAVPGSDGGTFRNRLFPSEYKNSFVAKTGTLMHTSTLAGAMNTQKGFIFFGIFNQSRDITGSKIVQNMMVKSIMTEMGGPLAFDYVVEGFHTFSDETFKGFGIISDFTTVEKGLY